MEIRNKTKPTVCLFVFEGFSDWEPSYALSELNRSGEFAVQTFGITMEPVKSMGGLTVMPDTTIDDDALQHAAMLVLPGGEALERNKCREILPMLEKVYENNIPVAAICAATGLLADLGLLDDIKHTSNALLYLKKVSGWYNGEEYYVEENAVADRNIITAGGVYPIEFAREIFKMLELYSCEKIEKWYQLFKNGLWAA